MLVAYLSFFFVGYHADWFDEFLIKKWAVGYGVRGGGSGLRGSFGAFGW